MNFLYLTEQDVDRLLDMPLAIDAMQEAFERLAAGEADNVPRVRARAPGIVLHSMIAAAPYLQLVGWKQYTTTRRGAQFHVGLYQQETGELLALIEANRLGQMRTGAVTGLAAKRLAPRAEHVTLFGSGWQAQSQLEAVATACPIERATVYSRNEDRRQAFARKMSASLGIEVTAVQNPRAAVENAPLVITATKSAEPVFPGQWLAPGTLVCAIGSNWLQKAEIDATAVRRANHVVCDRVDCCRNEAGDLAHAVSEGVFDWDQATELADVVAGSAAGRSGPDDIVIFKSVGMALEDVALGGKLLELVRGES